MGERKMHPYVKLSIEKVLPNGKALMRSKESYTQSKRALDEIVGERELFQKVYAELCPVRNYAINAMNRRDFKPVDTFLPIRSVRAFYHAKEFLEYSLETGVLERENKQALYERLLEFEKTYVATPGKTVDITNDTIRQFSESSLALLRTAQSIFHAYLDEESRTRAPYEQEKTRLYKDAAISGAGVLGVFILAKGLGKLGKLVART
ncbi:MAG: hypothetical protein V1725_05320 [archaeon]